LDALGLIPILVSAREVAGELSLLRPLEVGVGVIPDRVATQATLVELADDGLMDLVEPCRDSNLREGEGVDRPWAAGGRMGSCCCSS
jgi:hypothetical protein